MFIILYVSIIIYNYIYIIIIVYIYMYYTITIIHYYNRNHPEVQIESMDVTNQTWDHSDHQVERLVFGTFFFWWSLWDP